MSKKIPLFPLNLVAFPGERLKLHIFEPRYRQLVKDCVDNGLSFGIIPVSDKALSDIGTEMRIDKIDHAYADGKLDIISYGMKSFDLLDFSEKLTDKLYPGGEIEYKVNFEQTDLVLQEKLFKLLKKLYSSMGMEIDLPMPGPDYKVFSNAHKIGLSVLQEIELLRLESEIERLKFVVYHLERILPVVIQMEEMRQKVKMNGHFKDAIPPDFKI